tara:strand:- start:2114 stop:2311 length:198 start_codon:yes stop_codon:yes gene_type:complete
MFRFSWQRRIETRSRNKRKMEERKISVDISTRLLILVIVSLHSWPLSSVAQFAELLESIRTILPY